jgi:glycosyltransferase involved in cell wall biosynthesis
MPIVGLEAGFLGIPILCFDQTGGMVELAKKTKGIVVSYGDCLEVAKQIVKVKNETETEYDLRSASVMKEVRSSYTYEVIMNKIHDLVLKLL